MKAPDIIAGKYEIIDTIGKGGMGTVYRARQRSLDRIVAVKMLSEELASDTEFRARFQQEATIIAKLNHTNIIDVYDIEPHKHTFCIIMEFLEGETLQQRIDRDVTLPERDVVLIGAQVARALAYAHSQGIVHRDVKPDNIFVTNQGTAKIMDFGIARFLESKLKTQTGISMGTPKFMSPEQVTGKNVDGQTDLYSLGVCLYYCLAGRPPFDGENAISIATRHLYEQPTPPSQYNTSMTPAVEKVILKALEKNKAARYLTGSEMADALEATIGVKTPIRIAEEGVREIAAGATQKMSVHQYSATGTDVFVETDVTPHTPTGILRIKNAIKNKLETPPHNVTPIRSPSLDDFTFTPPTPPPAGDTTATLAFVARKWWPAAIAIVLIIAGMIYIATDRNQLPQRLDIPPAVNSGAQAELNRLEQKATDALTQKLTEQQMIGLYEQILQFQKNNPDLKRSQLQTLQSQIAVRLPLSAKEELAKRRDARAQELYDAKHQWLARAYYDAARDLYTGLKMSYGSGSRMLPLLDSQLTKTIELRSQQQAQYDSQAESAYKEAVDFAQRNSAEAETRFIQAIEAAPQNLTYWFALAEYYADTNRLDDARVILNAIEKSPGATAEARNRIAQLRITIESRYAAQS